MAKRRQSQKKNRDGAQGARKELEKSQEVDAQPSEQSLEPCLPCWLRRSQPAHPTGAGAAALPSDNTARGWHSPALTSQTPRRKKRRIWGHRAGVGKGRLQMQSSARQRRKQQQRKCRADPSTCRRKEVVLAPGSCRVLRMLSCQTVPEGHVNSNKQAPRRCCPTEPGASPSRNNVKGTKWAHLAPVRLATAVPSPSEQSVLVVPGAASLLSLGALGVSETCGLLDAEPQNCHRCAGKGLGAASCPCTASSCSFCLSLLQGLGRKTHKQESSAVSAAKQVLLISYLEFRLKLLAIWPLSKMTNSL